MTFARWYLIINGLILAGYGGWCIFNPQLVADLTTMTLSSTALTEVRAMYGGMQFALGLYCILMAQQPRHIEAAMIAIAMCFAGLCSVRALGIVLNGGDQYNIGGVVYEGIATALAVFGLVRLRKTTA